jgi:MFS superfamily sulfate permease-like transporter
VLFRWAAPLFFANAELFHRRVLEAIAESPTPVRRIIITAEPVTSVDVTSADVLTELEHTLSESGIELRFAEMKDPVKDKLKRFGLFDRFGAADFYPTIGSAVMHISNSTLSTGSLDNATHRLNSRWQDQKATQFRNLL